MEHQSLSEIDKSLRLLYIASESPKHGDISTTLQPTTRLNRNKPTPAVNKQTISKCHSIERKGMMWEETRAGEIANQECYDGTRGMTAFIMQYIHLLVCCLISSHFRKSIGTVFHRKGVITEYS